MKIWLHRLAAHKIYTLGEYLLRGRQLKPTQYDVDKTASFNQDYHAI